MRITAVLCRLQKIGSRGRAVRANNYWQLTRLRAIENVQVKEKMVERGRKVHSLTEVLSTPHLPEPKFQIEDFPDDGTVAKGFESERDHPFYHDRECYTISDRTALANDMQTDQAKVCMYRPDYFTPILTKCVLLGFLLRLLPLQCLTNSVELQSGLPSAILDRLPECENVLPDQDEAIKDLLCETMILDCTQRKLPRRVHVPYIGWNPVNDRMTSQLPYEVKYSYQRNMPLEYGIPVARKK